MSPHSRGPSPFRSVLRRQTQAQNQPHIVRPGVRALVLRLGSQTPRPPPPVVPANTAGLSTLATAPRSVQVWRMAAQAVAGLPRQPCPPCLS